MFSKKAETESQEDLTPTPKDARSQKQLKADMVRDEELDGLFFILSETKKELSREQKMKPAQIHISNPEGDEKLDSTIKQLKADRLVSNYEDGSYGRAKGMKEAREILGPAVGEQLFNDDPEMSDEAFEALRAFRVRYLEKRIEGIRIEILQKGGKA